MLDVSDFVNEVKRDEEQLQIIREIQVLIIFKARHGTDADHQGKQVLNSFQARHGTAADHQEIQV